MSLPLPCAPAGLPALASRKVQSPQPGSCCPKSTLAGGGETHWTRGAEESKGAGPVRPVSTVHPRAHLFAGRLQVFSTCTN